MSYTIVRRDGWGARPPKARFAFSTPAADWWLHHTATAQFGPSGCRDIQRFHMDVRGWHDIAYSWLYDVGRRTFFEGRGWGVRGSHTAGHNGNSHGLCVMGDWTSKTLPDTAVGDIARFVRQAAADGHGPPTVSGGHRDVGSTSCPGDGVYRRIADINRWTDESENDMTPQQAEMLERIHTELTREDVRGTVARYVQTTNAAVGRMERTHGPGLEQLTSGGTDPAGLAAEIADRLGPDLAAEVAAELSRRLAS